MWKSIKFQNIMRTSMKKHDEFGKMVALRNQLLHIKVCALIIAKAIIFLNKSKTYDFNKMQLSSEVFLLFLINSPVKKTIRKT